MLFMLFFFQTVFPNKQNIFCILLFFPQTALPKKKNKKSSKLFQTKSRSGNRALLLSNETIYHQNYLPV